MKIRGKIYNKRSYQNSQRQSLVNLLFVEVEECVQVNGDMIKVIPIIIDRSFKDVSIGEKIEADGEIEYERIVTTMGKRSFLPIPIFRTINHLKVI